MIVTKEFLLNKLIKSSYFLFLLLIPASVFRVNASIPGYDSFFLFRVVLLFLVFIYALVFLLDKDLFFKRLEILLKEKYATVFFIGWLAFSLVSYFWIADFENYFRYNALLAIDVAFVLALVFFIRSKRILFIVWRLILLTLAVSVLAALFEIFFGFRLSGSSLIEASRSYRLFVTSFFNHPNDFGSYISLTLPFITLLPLYKDYKKYKWWALILVVLTIFVLTFTGSKINYMATLIGSILTIFILFKNRITGAVAYFSVIIVLIFSIFPSLGPDISNRILESTNKEISDVSYRSIKDGTKYEGTLDEISGGYGSYTIRKNLTQNAISVIVNDPKKIIGVFSGVGAGQSEFYLSEFQNTRKVSSLHNWWLEVVVNHGVLIGIGYIALYLWLLRTYFRKANKAKDSFLKYINFSILVSLVLFALTSISPSSSVGFSPLWFILGLSIAAKKL